MRQLLVKGGQLVVDEVPVPSVEPEHVLVQTLYSCVSVGTELAGVAQNSLPLWRRAIVERARVAQVVNMAKTVGVRNTLEFVQNKLSSAKPLGYSLSGRVVRVGDGVTHVSPGDLVACGGAQCANHAEFVVIPKNLTVRAPPGIQERDASMATVGAIALQGVRRANPTIGETFLVVGLGLLGLLTVQILKANGCVVIGVDLDEKRSKFARSLGADFTLTPDSADDLAVLQFSHGYGADGVIVTAGSKSNAILSTAFGLTRKKGRVVIVGDVGLSLNRADFYAKEIDVLISCSYGPGRYDRVFEEAGLDYPLPYVRWTEARNIECFMELVAQGRVSVDALRPVSFPLEQAASAYEKLAERETAPLAVFLTYAAESHVESPAVRGEPSSVSVESRDRLRLAVVGAGAFASAVHVPNLRKLRQFVEVAAVVGRTPYRAKEVASELGASQAGTDLGAVLARTDIDAVLVATRHDTHARIAQQALEAGKHVFLEKPTVLNREELRGLEETMNQLERDRRLPILMTGYNRRFSTLAKRVQQIVKKRACPLVISYRMAAGFLPADHWSKGPEGGGRNIGEGCHIYDLFGYLVDSPVRSVKATRLGGADGAYQLTDNFTATVLYDDGSMATLVYTAQGSPMLEKERLELFSERKALVIDNWRSLTIYGKEVEQVSLRTQDKGFEAELDAFITAARQAGPWPIPWTQQRDTADVAILVQEQLSGTGGCAA